jgi:hypothetical protein
MTHRASVVLDVDVEYEGQMHRATYFVEGDVVHARVGGRVLISPLAGGDAQEKVRTLMMGHLLIGTRRARQATSWTTHT